MIRPTKSSKNELQILLLILGVFNFFSSHFVDILNLTRLYDAICAPILLKINPVPVVIFFEVQF